MFGLKKMQFSRNFYEQTQEVFGGIDRRKAAGNGAIADMLNMSAAEYPLLTVRPRRREHATVLNPQGFFARDCLCWAQDILEDGVAVAGRLVVDGEEVARLTHGPKLIAGIQSKLCVWPDKVIFDRETGLLAQMEAEWEGEGTFQDGTYAGEPALANTIKVAADLTGIFRAGDGVAVTAGVGGVEGEPMGAYVIQEIEYDAQTGKTELRFLEETWREFVTETDSTGGGDGMVGFPGVGTQIGIRIQRRAPELQGVFEHHNRLWGWHGGTVLCSKLGDPTNWEGFNGDATDSWELVTGSPGDITGGISYGGRPLFFKENRIIRIYGDYPGQFSTSESESLGVEKGSGRSLAIAGDVLYYLSNQGIMAYSGGYPWCISEELGDTRYRNAVAGSDGVRYYVSMEREDGESDVMCYDTRHRVWHQENGMKLIGLGWNGELYALEERGWLWVLGEPKEQVYEEMLTWVEFADFYEGTTRKKTPGRLVLRLEMDKGVELDILIRYDSRGEWIKLRSYKGPMVKDQDEVVIPLRRCDHYRVKLDGRCKGDGTWTLHALTRERCVGSNRK